MHFWGLTKWPSLMLLSREPLVPKFWTCASECQMKEESIYYAQMPNAEKTQSYVVMSVFCLASVLNFPHSSPNWTTDSHIVPYPELGFIW